MKFTTSPRDRNFDYGPKYGIEMRNLNKNESES